MNESEIERLCLESVDPNYVEDLEVNLPPANKYGGFPIPSGKPSGKRHGKRHGGISAERVYILGDMHYPKNNLISEFDR